jgi:hypothetical protein
MSAADGIAQVNTLATHTAFSVWGFASNFLIVILLTGAFFLFAWQLGRGSFVALLIAIYAAFAVYTVFPYASFFPITTSSLTPLVAHLLLYAALVFGFFIILRRVIISDFIYIGPVALVGLSFLGAAFLLAIGYHTFLIASAYHFTPEVAALFAPDQFFFWWFIAPAIGLFFLA